MTDARLQAADRSYQQAVFAGDPSGLAPAERELAGVEADLALARGRLLHARYLQERSAEDPEELRLFEQAARIYADLGDQRGEGEALFWVGIVHQVIRDDQETAVPLFERSLALAADSDDDLTRSYALRHLGIAAHAAGDLAAARSHLEASTRLRQELGFHAGAAANLVGLAYLAAAEERTDDVRRILDEALDLVDRPEAAGVRVWVEEARADLGL